MLSWKLERLPMLRQVAPLACTRLPAQRHGQAEQASITSGKLFRYQHPAGIVEADEAHLKQDVEIGQEKETVFRVQAAVLIISPTARCGTRGEPRGSRS
jgi:hypothetical protein